MGASQAAPVAPPAIVRPHIPLGIVVVIACVAGFMVVMDSSIVNVALPTMRADLDLSTSEYQWVVDAYLLTLGGFLLLGARASDLFGRKLVLQVGVVIFTIASLVGGLAGDGMMLIVCRAAQGIGGSVLAPAGLGLIIATHHGAGRAKAMSHFAAASSIAAAAGVVIGGILTQEASWRWVMFVNVPIGCLLFAAIGASLLPSLRDTTRTRLDIGGALTITLGMGALIYGLSRASTGGWAATRVIVALAAAVVLIAAFALIELRVPQPLVRLGVFRLRNLTIGNLVVACLGVALTASVFFVSLVLQEDIGYSALRTGLAMAPMGLALAATSISSARLISIVKPRTVLFTGGLIGAVGLLWLAAMPDHPDYATDVVGPLIVAGAGLGLMIMPSTRAAAAGLPPHEAGLAAGLFNMARQLGAAIGLAALVTLATAIANHQRHTHAAQLAQLHGYRAALLATACVSAAAAVAALCLHRDHHD